MKKTILASTLSIAFAISANATTVLTAGGTPTSPDTFSTISGPVLASMSGALPAPLVGSSTFTGTYDTAVIADANNVFGAGDLDFVYQVFDTGNGTKPGSQGIIENVTSNSFFGFSVDGGYDTTTMGDQTADLHTFGFSGGGVVPMTDQLNGDASTVQFNYNTGTPIMVGQHSVVLVVETNATSYDSFGLFSAIDGSTSTVLAFEPVSSPEPGTLLLVGAGLCSLGVIRRRRTSTI